MAVSELKSPVKQSEEEVFASPAKEGVNPSPGRDSGNGSFVETNESKREEGESKDEGVRSLEKGEIPASQVCAKLCHLIKSQLVKSHEEVVARFGGEAVSAAVLKTTLEGENDDEDLDQMVSRGLRALNFVPFAETVPLAEAEVDNDEYSDEAKVRSETVDVSPITGKLKKLSEARKEKEDVTLKKDMKILKEETRLLEQEADSITLASADNKPLDCAKVEDNQPKVETPPAESSSIVDNSASAEEDPLNPPLPDGAGSLNDSVTTAASTIPLSPGSFMTVETVPVNHKFKLTMFQPADMKSFVRFVRREMKLLRTALPPGIRVKGFDDRMDLYSACIEGPKNTPYENGLFFFDFQLGPDYPSVPPTCHYISYCSDRLNPNLYEDGKVCVSLLGTWSGKGTETWTPNSNLLQLLVSIQGLILVNEPYFNEAGYERQKGTQQGRENSRMYNEMALLKLVQSMNRLIHNPPEIFNQEIMEHFQTHAGSLISRLEKWRSISVCHNTQHPTSPTTPGTFASSSSLALDLPEFPLIPT